MRHTVEKGLTSREPAGVDEVLVRLIALADRESEGSAATSVTLALSGILVAGTIACEKAYCQAALEQLPLGKPDLGPFVGALADVKGALGESPVIDSFPVQGSRPDCIHLCDVEIFAPHTVMHLQWWRGRLDRIDGFALGTQSK